MNDRQATEAQFQQLTHDGTITETDRECAIRIMAQSMFPNPEDAANDLDGKAVLWSTPRALAEAALDAIWGELLVDLAVAAGALEPGPGVMAKAGWLGPPADRDAPDRIGRTAEFWAALTHVVDAFEAAVKSRNEEIEYLSYRAKDAEDRLEAAYSLDGLTLDGRVVDD